MRNVATLEWLKMMNDKRNKAPKKKKKFDSVMLEYICFFFFRSDAGKNTPKKKKGPAKTEHAISFSSQLEIHEWEQKKNVCDGRYLLTLNSKALYNSRARGGNAWFTANAAEKLRVRTEKKS